MCVFVCFPLRLFTGLCLSVCFSFSISVSLFTLCLVCQGSACVSFYLFVPIIDSVFCLSLSLSFFSSQIETLNRRQRTVATTPSPCQASSATASLDHTHTYLPTPEPCLAYPASLIITILVPVLLSPYHHPAMFILPRVYPASSSYHPYRSKYFPLCLLTTLTLSQSRIPCQASYEAIS